MSIASHGKTFKLNHHHRRNPQYSCLSLQVWSCTAASIRRPQFLLSLFNVNFMNVQPSMFAAEKAIMSNMAISYLGDSPGMKK